VMNYYLDRNLPAKTQTLCQTHLPEVTSPGAFPVVNESIPLYRSHTR
jgi:hypothetical protein